MDGFLRVVFNSLLKQAPSINATCGGLKKKTERSNFNKKAALSGGFLHHHSHNILRCSKSDGRPYDVVRTWGAKSKATPMDAVHRGRLLFMTYGTQSSTARRTLQNRCCEIAREHCAAASDLGGCGCTLARCASRTKAR